MAGIDHILSVVRAILRACEDGSRWIRVRLSSGRVLEGPLHYSLQLEDVRALIGKVWDLSKAYRRLARFPGHASATVVGVWDPTAKEKKLFMQPVVAFGESAGVVDFNWVARALQWVLVADLSVLASSR